MNILIACECSQVETEAFLKKGHNVYSCDIQKSYGKYPDRHIMQDVRSLLNGNVTFRTQDNAEHSIHGEWDMIIAHPPCTYLSKAGGNSMYTKPNILNMQRYKKAMEAKELFMDIYNAKCKKFA